MKKIIALLVILISLSVLFSNCKNSEKEALEKMRKDSVLNASKNLSAPAEYSKYAINPPDPDYTGDYIDKYPNGVIKFTGFFRFGQRHGEWMAFFETGIKWSDCFYDKGKKHGATMVFHPNGNLLYSGWYKNDMRDSLWFWYDDKGKEIDRRAFKNDIETGLVN